jgi:hypothetical protein
VIYCLTIAGSSTVTVSTDQVQIRIPVMQATEELLSYYSAHLIQSGDIFKFQTKNTSFGIFTMEVGEHYVAEYIIGSGVGLYLEHHNEPHYHEPMDKRSGGVYLLAKKIGHCNSKEYHITAFAVNYGTAVYTEPGE